MEEEAFEIVKEALEAKGWSVARKGKTIVGDSLVTVNPKTAKQQWVYVSEPERASP